MKPNPGPAPLLVVDDQWEDAFLTQRLLRSTKTRHPIHSVSGGAKAIEYLGHCLSKGEPLPCAIFADSNMAGVSGLDLLIWIQQHDALEGIWTVLFFDRKEPAEMEKASEMGARVCLSKFPSTETLTEVLAQVFQASPEPHQANNPRLPISTS